MADDGTIRLPITDNDDDPNDPFAGMSEADLAAAKAAIERRLTPEAPKFQYRLPDGRQVQGTQDEVQRELDSYLAQARQPQPDRRGNDDRPAQPEPFNRDRFGQLHNEGGPEAALDYYLQTKFQGQDPVQLMAQMGMALQNVGNHVVNANKSAFLGRHDGAKPEAYQKALDFCLQNGMNATDATNLDRAYLWLKHEGQIQEEQPANTRQPNATLQPQPGFSNQPDYGQRGQDGPLPNATAQNFVPQHFEPQGSPGNRWVDVPNDVNAIEQSTRHMSTDQLRAAIEQTLSNGGLPN